MGKVTANRIVFVSKGDQVSITKDELMMSTADGPARVPEPMHLNEEMVLVFDEHGNCVGNVEHHKLDEIQ